MAEDKTVRKLRKKLEAALAKQKIDEAVVLLGKLMEADPRAPRWPHKRGDLLRKQRKRKEAVAAYEVAVDLYADQGFIARAVAMAKTVLNLDPSRIDVLEKVDPQAAQLLHRQQRPASISNAPHAHPAVIPDGTQAHPAVIPDGTQAHPAVIPDGTQAHPAVIPDGPPRAHPAVLPDDTPAAAPKHHPAVIPDDTPMTHPAVLPDDTPAAAPQHHPAVIPDEPPAAAPQHHPAVIPDEPPAAAPQHHPAVIPDEPPEPPAAPAQRKPLDDLSLPPPRPQQAPPPAMLEPVDDDVIELDEAAELEGPGAISLPAPPGVPDLSTRVLDQVDELVIAPDAQPHETRFSNAPPASSGGISLELSAIELGERQLAPPAMSVPPSQPSAKNLSQLPLFPLFAEMPKQVLADLVQGSDVVELDDGALLMRKGDPADCLYGIIEGNVQITVPGQQIKLVLAEGDVFGESCLLAGERRHADVEVKGHLLALKIPRETLNRMIGMHPPLAEVLLELLTRRLLGNLLQASPMFMEFDAQGRQELARAFEIRRAAAGTMLAEIGKVMDGLYITLTGTLEVSYQDGRPAEHHEAGAMFGQNSLLTREPSDVAVRATNNMIVLRMPSEAFQAFAMQYPSILAQVSEMAGTPVARVSF
jgi:CRP-like cAMP-binding protein